MNEKHENLMPPERIALLVRIYHSPRYAAEAIGASPESVRRAAKRNGLKFRQDSLREEQYS